MDDSFTVPVAAPVTAPPPVAVASHANVVDATTALQAPPARSRAGTVSKGTDRKAPARPEGNGKTTRPATRPEFDPRDWAEKYDIWRVNEKAGCYFMRDPHDGGWMFLAQGQLELWLQSFGLSKGDKNEPVREVERVILWVQAKRKLDTVISLAGHRPGVVKIDTLTILIPKGPELPIPVQGDWSSLRRLLEGMFLLPIDGPEMPHHFQVFVKSVALPLERTVQIWRTLVREVSYADEERGEESTRWVFDQTLVVYSWLRLMLQVLYRRMAGEDVARNGQALIIASRADGGKTLLIGLLKKLLGGRMADVEQWATGKTTFNGDATAAELLRISDAPLSTKMEDRLLLGEFIKHVVAENEHRVHPKGRDASCTLPMIQRLVWAHNDDGDNLRQVPPMKPELRDKVLWVRANSVEMSAPTAELDDYMNFGKSLRSELAAFAWWLLHEFTIPTPMVGNRFGMLGIQEPSLIRELYEDSPGSEFLDMLDAARWTVAGEQVGVWDFVWSRTETVRYGEASSDKRRWTAHYLTLQRVLSADECSLADDFTAFFKVNKLHRLLGRLDKEVPHRVMRDRNRQKRFWHLIRPPQ